MYDAYAPRIESQGNRILKLINDGNWHTNAELAKVALAYRNVVSKLRDRGYIISSRHRGSGVWEYRLVGKHTHKRTRSSLSDPQLRVRRAVLDAVGQKLGPEAQHAVEDALPMWLTT